MCVCVGVYKSWGKVDFRVNRPLQLSLFFFGGGGGVSMRGDSESGRVSVHV